MNPTYGTDLAKAAAYQPNLGGSPNGNSAQMQNLQNLAASGFRSSMVDKTTGGFIGNANQVIAEQAAARAAAASAANAEERKQAVRDKMAADLADPKNYIKQVADDGGWNFYKPDGTPISVLEYSRVVGKQVPDVLSGSQNQQDADFADSYKSLLEYGRALQGDDAAVTAFKTSKNGKDFLSNPENKNQTYETVVAAFNKNYGKYLQPLQTDTLASKDASGKNISQDTIDMGSGQPFINFKTGDIRADWLKNYRIKNVNYR